MTDRLTYLSSSAPSLTLPLPQPNTAPQQGLAWLFLGVANKDALLYDDEWQSVLKSHPNNFRVDYALSREQTNKAGGKMYIQDKMEEYADEIFDRLSKGAHIYFCGLKGMMPGIQETLERVASSKVRWITYFVPWGCVCVNLHGVMTMTMTAIIYSRTYPHIPSNTPSGHRLEGVPRGPQEEPPVARRGVLSEAAVSRPTGRHAARALPCVVSVLVASEYVAS